MRGLLIILRWLRTSVAAFAVLTFAPAAAYAECVFSEPATAHGVDGVPEESALSSLWPKLDTLGGIRPPLARNGIQVSATYIDEVLGNPSGGLEQGTHYDGLLDVHLDANM